MNRFRASDFIVIKSVSGVFRLIGGGSVGSGVFVYGKKLKKEERVGVDVSGVLTRGHFLVANV
jgi:hypothetical protein